MMARIAGLVCLGQIFKRSPRTAWTWVGLSVAAHQSARCPSSSTNFSCTRDHPALALLIEAPKQLFVEPLLVGSLDYVFGLLTGLMDGLRRRSIRKT